MKSLPFLLSVILGLSLALVISCSAGQNSSSKQAVIPLLHFQKTACLGTCPSYEATIMENGSIRYIGYNHVPVEDTVIFTLTPQQMKELHQEVLQLNPASLKDTYLTNWSDMPSTVTTFYEAGKEVKRVQQEEGGPQVLLDFQEKVHSLLMGLANEEAKRRLPVK